MTGERQGAAAYGLTASSLHLSIHVEVNANVLMAFDGPTILKCREEAPLPKRGKQQLTQPRVLCGLHQIDIERTIRMDGKVRNGDRPIALLAKIVRDFRQGLR